MGGAGGQGGAAADTQLRVLLDREAADGPDTVIVNAFANLVLLPTLGFVGAAVATTLTFAVLCVATHARARDVYPLDVAWGRVLGPGALAAALAAFAVLAPLPAELALAGSIVHDDRLPQS